jgi:hypothetical protein
MSLFDIKDLVEKVMEHIDLVGITKGIMANLVIRGEDMYFVIAKDEFGDNRGEPQFVGMAYSRDSAQRLRDQHKDHGFGDDVKIIQLDLGKLVALADAVGATEEIE